MWERLEEDGRILFGGMPLDLLQIRTRRRQQGIVKLESQANQLTTFAKIRQ